MSRPPRKTAGDTAGRPSGRNNKVRDVPRPPSQISGVESAPEMRERDPENRNKNGMRTSGLMSHSSHHSSGNGSRDRARGVGRSNPPGKDEREKASGNPSSKNSRGHGRREPDRGKEKSLQVPSGDNRESSRTREDLPKGRRRDRRQQSKSRVAPPQETLANSQKTQDGKTHEGNPSPRGNHAIPPEGKPEDKGSEDGAMRTVHDVLRDIKLEIANVKARKHWTDEEKEQTRQDFELAMGVKQEEIRRSMGDDHRDQQSKSGSEESGEIPQPTGIGLPFHPPVVLGPPMTKEERLTEDLLSLKESYKELSEAYEKLEGERHQKEKEARNWYDQGHIFYMECGELQRTVEIMEQERISMSLELALTKKQLSDAMNLSEARDKELKDLRSGLAQLLKGS